MNGSPTQSSCAAILEYNCQFQSSEDFIENNIQSKDSHQSANGGGDNTGNSNSAFVYLEQLLWRRRHCKLLNKDFTMLGRAKIQVRKMNLGIMMLESSSSRMVGTICK
jgi:hypothetical protein